VSQRTLDALDERRRHKPRQKLSQDLDVVGGTRSRTVLSLRRQADLRTRRWVLGIGAALK
jgi:hypothetical protein